VIFGGNLNGQKARMQLMLLLGGDYTKEEIKTSFERDFYHKKVSIPFEA
jgi:L-asparaginase